MATNSNYVTLLNGFSSGEGADVYQAPNSAEFNADAAFGAAVLFMIDAAIQEVTAPTTPVDQTLWGNIDVAGTAGWRIALLDDGNGQLELVGQLGTGALLHTLTTLLSNAEGPAFVERLICAALWYDDAGNVALSVNGSIVDQTAALAYGASQFAPTLGARQTAVGTYVEGATRAKIAGAAFSPITVVNTFTLGGLAGNSFNACRAGYSMGYLTPLAGADWVHRYDVAAAASGVSGAVTKSAKGAIASSFAAAPSSLADVGNLGPTSLDSGAPAVALARVGSMQVTQIENPDWYNGSGYVFIPPA